MTRELAYYVREGCHGEWCIDQEQMSPQGRFISRAATRADAERLVKELNAAAGKLKLDEPKSAEAKFKQELFDLGWRSDARNFLDVFECLEAGGLKIVER